MGMYCTRGFVIKLVRPMGDAKSLNGSSVPKFREGRDPLLRNCWGRRGYHWGHWVRLKQLTRSAVDFQSQNQHFSTKFFCYDSLGRARGGEGRDPNAHQLFGEAVGTIGAHWGRLKQLTQSAVDIQRQNQPILTQFVCDDSLGRARGGEGGDPNAPQLFSKPPATIGAHFFPWALVYLKVFVI